MKTESIFLILTLVFSLITINPVLAESQTSFFAKGIVTGEHFENAVMWTGIKDTEGIFINQWELGRTKIHTTLSPMETCEPEYKICKNAIVVESTNSAAVSVGDRFTIKIDSENKKQVITGIEGFLENVDIVIDFTKIYDRTNYKSVSYTDTRPNILLVVLDDVGFADLSITGSEIPTPTFDSLRNEGKLFTNFHTLPTCSPTRSVLMTGVDNHLNGLGTMTEMMAPNQIDQPGYEGYLNDDVVTVPQLLQDHGYHTYMTGKWHLSYGAFDPTDNWEKWLEYSPHARGFEETFSVELPGSHFTDIGLNEGHIPVALRNNEVVDYPQTYIDDVFTDYMIEFINKNESDEKPMFMYLSFWNAHYPIQAPEDYIKKYEGMYDAGWDVIREQRLEKQKELGLISQEMVLPPRNDWIPAWDALNATQQKQESKKMEIYAAMIDSIDDNLGRVVDHLKAIDQYDNTVIFVFADNGAEATDPTKVGHGADPKTYHQWLENTYNNEFPNWGNGDSYLGIGAGWAQVGNNPLFREKGYQTEGGTLVPMIVKIPEQNFHSKTDAFSRVADVSATILDYAQIQHSGEMYNGQKIYPMNGKSLKPILDGDLEKIYGDDEPIGSELFGNSALYKGDWKALYLDPPMGDGTWKLFNLAQDRGEQNNLSTQNPEKLDELIRDYEDYAKRVGVITPEGLEIHVESDIG